MSPSQAGYTLLEMIVVMAILAVSTAIAAPPSYRMARAWQEATQVDDVLQQIEHLPSQVRTTGTPLNVQGEDEIPSITLPPGWTLRLETPLQVQVNGACSDSEATLVTTHQAIGLRIQAPFCRIQRLTP